MLLKQRGPQVFNSLVFDVESMAISVYIEEINIHHLIKLKEDPRIDRTDFNSLDDELKVKCSLKKQIEVNSLEDSESTKMVNEISFKVLDKVKIKVETTTEFPLDLKCTVMISKDDMEEYSEIKKSMEKNDDV